MARPGENPVKVESPIGNGGDVGQYTSMAVVNGNPAIAYYDASHKDLMFVRTTDADGTSWGTLVSPDSHL